MMGDEAPRSVSPGQNKTEMLFRGKSLKDIVTGVVYVFDNPSLILPRINAL